MKLYVNYFYLPVYSAQIGTGIQRRMLPADVSCRYNKLLSGVWGDTPASSAKQISLGVATLYTMYTNPLKERETEVSAAAPSI